MPITYYNSDMEIDHVFILTTANAPEADLVAELGFVEGPSNTHPGQGTANRRFFFQNFGLELLFVCDEEEATHGIARGLRIPDRLHQKLASPFGLIARGSEEDETFPSWQYHPEYFERGQYFRVGDNSDQLQEPLCVCMPSSLPVAAPDLRKANGQMNLTKLDVSVPVNPASKSLTQMASSDVLSLCLGRPHHMTVTFNGSVSGRSHDLSPALPLTIRW